VIESIRPILTSKRNTTGFAPCARPEKRLRFQSTPTLGRVMGKQAIFWPASLRGVAHALVFCLVAGVESQVFALGSPENAT
jgi:hypothetical protein